MDYHNATKNPEKAGKPYLNFWIVDNGEKLRPKQRSQGVRWFLSFYLQLRASAKIETENGLVLLIDEPAESLHARAQEDVLRVFEQLKDNIQIVYTTHSPYLLDVNKIYRLIAAQREEQGNAYSPSDTKILTAHELGSASTDTLTPIFDCMGINFAGQNVIERQGNVILEEISAYYYLQAILKLKGETQRINFLPATGTSNIPTLANLLLGWGIKYGILVDDEASAKRIIRQLKKEIFPDDQTLGGKLFKENSGCEGIEDLFTKTDFAKHVVGTSPSTISISNSKYVAQEGLSKGLVAVKFLKKVEDGSITLSSLQVGTKNNINAVHTLITEIVSTQSTY